MKEFNKDVFITALFIWILLNVFSMFFFVNSYGLFKFPTIILFGRFIPDNFAYYATGLFINAAFYAVVIERIYYKFRKKRKNQIDPKEKNPPETIEK